MAEFLNRRPNRFIRFNRFNRLARRIQTLYQSARINLIQMEMNFTMNILVEVTEVHYVNVLLGEIDDVLVRYENHLKRIFASYLIGNITSLPPYITATADPDDGFFEYDLFEVYGDAPEEEGVDLDHSDEMKEMRKKLLDMLYLILVNLKVQFGEEYDPDAELITVVIPGPYDVLTRFQVQEKLQLGLANKFLERVQMMAITVLRAVEGEDDPDDNEGSGPSEHSIGSDADYV